MAKQLADQHTKMKQQVKDIQLYIDGQVVDDEHNRVFENSSPFTNETINKVAMGEQADIDKAVHAAKNAFRRGVGQS